MHALSKTITLLCAGISALVLCSCGASMHKNDRQVSPSFGESKLRSLKSFHVQRHADDDYKMSEKIATEIRNLGYRATEGGPDSKGSGADAIVTYMDRWYWDMSPYLFNLSIKLRHPSSGSLIATAETTRSSLARKSESEMANETFQVLMGTKTPVSE